jgi:hypothetical protein
MCKCSKTINRFYRAKVIVDKILSDRNIVKKIQQFILTERGRGSEEYVTTYSEVDDIIRQITSERVVILKSDGQFYYDSGINVYDAVGVYNHNSRPEVMASVKFLYGGDTINKTALINKYPKKLRSMILAGYGIASRSSSTTKTIQSYVSKTYSDKGNPLNVNIFTLRVSIKHDDSSDNNIIPVNKKAIIKKRDWFENGVEFNKEDTPILQDGGKKIETTLEQLAECVTFLYKSARSYG